MQTKQFGLRCCFWWFPLPQFISIFQHIRAECAMVLHENKAEIRTEGGATKLCLCVRFIYLFIFYFRLYFLSNELLRALFFSFSWFVFRVRPMRSIWCYNNAVQDISKPRRQNKRKRNNTWIIYPLFDFWQIGKVSPRDSTVFLCSRPHDLSSRFLVSLGYYTDRGSVWMNRPLRKSNWSLT